MKRLPLVMTLTIIAVVGYVAVAPPLRQFLELAAVSSSPDAASIKKMSHYLSLVIMRFAFFAIMFGFAYFFFRRALLSSEENAEKRSQSRFGLLVKKLWWLYLIIIPIWPVLGIMVGISVCVSDRSSKPKYFWLYLAIVLITTLLGLILTGGLHVTPAASLKHLLQRI